jgi:hypothetical protein
MSELVSNVILVRGLSYTVREINGRTMREVRKRLRDSPETVEAFLAWACTVEPKFASESAATDEPHLLLKAISEEAFRLSRPPPAPENAEAKND